MRIKTQFLVTMFLFGTVLAAIAASALVTNHLVKKTSEQENIAGDIAQGASELSYLANDYVIFQESQQLERWQSRFASFSNDVSLLEVDNPEQQALVRNIQANSQRLEDVFDSVVSAIGTSSQDGETIAPALLQLSWSRLAVQSQTLVSDASRLVQILDSQESWLHTVNTIDVIVLTSIFVLYFLINYMTMQRRALKGLARLQEGTAVIGGGDLDFRIEEKGNDEIGDLSRAVNRMTTNLKTITASKTDLEREIAKRSEVEEELRISNEHLQDQAQKLEVEIDERKKSEEALKEVNEQLDLALNSATLGTFDYDLKNGVVHWDERTKQMCGIPGGDDPDYKEAAEFLHPDDRQRVENILTKAFAPDADGTYEAEFRIVRPDGGIFWNRAMGKVFFEGEGPDRKAVRQIGVNQDITERKKSEEALRQSEERFRALSETSPVGVGVSSSEGVLLYTNPSYELILGYERGELVGRKASSLYWNPNERQSWVSSMNENGVVRDFETRLEKKDGTPVWVSINVSPILYVGERAVMGTIQDITARKKADELKDDFIGMVSHELRTPLTVFLSSVQVAMIEEISKEEIRELLEDAVTSAKSMAHLVDNMIELSRYQANRLSLNTRMMDVAAVTREVITRERTEKGHDFLVDIEEDLPLLKADQVRLELVLKNLINNAIKYSPPKTQIRISAKKDGAFVMIGVTDHGKGLSQADQTKLFQSFERLRETSLTNPGLGLGLLVCQRLVEAHGGRIWAESEVGHGSTFWFTLPVNQGTP